MLQIRRISRMALAALILGGVYPVAVSAQEGGPLLKSDLVRMMTASTFTGTEMAAIVRMNCVGFEPTARDRRQLSTLRGSDLIMVEIDRCVSNPRTAARSNRNVESPAPVKTRAARTPPKPSGKITLVDVNVEPSGSSIPLLQDPTRGAKISSISRRATKPELTNWSEVTKAFLNEYRPNVRSPGTVILSITVGSDGSVLDAAVKESTGDHAMTEAALRVTEVMKFTPAMMGDEAVESLTQLPINFATN